MPDPEQYLNSLQDVPSEQPRRRWGKRIAVTLAALFVGIILYVGYLAYIISGASTRAFSVTPLVTDGAGHTNVLLLGVGNPGHAGEKLSDSMMVVSFDRQDNRLVYIGIPRDLRVRPEGYGPMKINRAHAVGGPELARSAVEDVLGIEIQYVVRTDFDGLSGIVDAVGGLDVEVAEALRDSSFPCADDERRACGLVIEAGKQHMDGATALAYARCRKGNCGNDFGRAERQQEVINLIIAKLAIPAMVLHPVQVGNIAGVVREHLLTDLSGMDLLQLLITYDRSDDAAERLVLNTDHDGLLTGAAGSSDLVPVGGTFVRIQAKVAELIR